MTGPLALVTWAASRPFRVDPPTLADVAAAPARVGAPVATNRRIAVASLDGGAGTSTVAAALAGVLAVPRPGTVLAVSAHGAPRGLAHHLGAATPTEQTAGVEPPGAPLPTAAGVAVLDAGDPDAAEPVVETATWWEAVSEITRRYDVTITDFGRRPSPDDLGGIAERNHALCLVAHADRHSAELAALAAARLAAGAAGVPTVLCLVDRQGLRARSARVLRARGVAVTTVPRERSLEAEPWHRAMTGLTTALSLQVLAGTVLAAARGTMAASRRSVDPVPGAAAVAG